MVKDGETEIKTNEKKGKGMRCFRRFAKSNNKRPEELPQQVMTKIYAIREAYKNFFFLFFLYKDERKVGWAQTMCRVKENEIRERKE